MFINFKSYHKRGISLKHNTSNLYSNHVDYIHCLVSIGISGVEKYKLSPSTTRSKRDPFVKNFSNQTMICFGDTFTNGLFIRAILDRQKRAALMLLLGFYRNCHRPTRPRHRDLPSARITLPSAIAHTLRSVLQ